MQSRMDKYNTEFSAVRSRTQKNQSLYEDVKNSSIKDFDVNSNVQVIDDGSSIIDVGHVRQILDDKYSSNAPRRRTIALPDDFNDEIEEVEDNMDTKEYDINAILSKAKAGKNVDYSKERLRKIRDAQYEILNNLDLELKKIEEPEDNEKQKKDEENLMNLISTITHIEAINKEKYSKEVSGAMDLLGLGDDDETPEDENETKESTVVSKLKEEVAESKKDDDTSMEIELIREEETKDDHIEKTLSKLDINLSSYDDFKDISKGDKSSIVVKIVMFVLILGLIFGAVYILNNMLNLNLF